MLHSVSDSFTAEDSLLGCNLLPETPCGIQSISALPSSSSYPSAAPSCGAGSSLEEFPPGQATSGKTSALQPHVCWVVWPRSCRPQISLNMGREGDPVQKQKVNSYLHMRCRD